MISSLKVAELAIKEIRIFAQLTRAIRMVKIVKYT